MIVVKNNPSAQHDEQQSSCAENTAQKTDCNIPKETTKHQHRTVQIAKSLGLSVVICIITILSIFIIKSIFNK